MHNMPFCQLVFFQDSNIITSNVDWEIFTACFVFFSFCFIFGLLC